MEYTMFIDVETTGFIKSNPYLVSIAYSIYANNVTNDDFSKEMPSKVLEYYTIVKPPSKDYIIPEESVKVHGITTQMAQEQGISNEEVINNLHCVFDVYNIKTIVAHNIDFDISVMFIQFKRYDVKHTACPLKQKMYDKIVYCTMKETTDMMNLQRNNSRGSYKKYPKLQELYHKLFDGEDFPAHNALEDVRACVRCYYKHLYNIDIYK
jgi:DNA polymerase III epsilon subunit-like protein